MGGGGEAELSQAFFSIAIWTMSHIFLGGKATVSQKIMGAFLPLCQGEVGSICRGGAGGMRGVLGLRCCPASSCWRSPSPSTGCQGEAGVPPGLPAPCLQPLPHGAGDRMGDAVAHPPPGTPACPRPDPAPPGGLNSALYIRQVKRHQQSPLPSKHPWVLQHPRSTDPVLGTLGGSGEGFGGSTGGTGEGWGTRSKCLHVIKAVKPSWKGESCVCASVCTRGHGHVPRACR